jgi:hypothetical protein
LATLMNSELDPALQAMLDALIQTTSTVHLFSNNYVPTPSDTLGNYTEATYSTYAAVVLTVAWGPAAGGSGGLSAAPSAGALFAPGILGTPQDCYGWYVTDALGNLLGADVFSGGPLNMGGTTPAVIVTPALSLS